MEEVARLVIALDGNNGAIGSQVPGENGADGVEPAFAPAIERLAGIARDRVLVGRMQSPGGIEMEASGRGSGLDCRVVDDPFGKPKIGQFGIDEWSRAHLKPEALLLAECDECLDILARIYVAPVEESRFDFVNRPRNVGFDHAEPKVLNAIEDLGPEVSLQPPIVDRARIDRHDLIADLETGIGHETATWCSPGGSIPLSRRP